MYVCMNVSSQQNVGNIVVMTKIPVILHSIEFEILTCTMLKIAFPGLQISKFSGAACPQTPIEARAFGARI